MPELGARGAPGTFRVFTGFMTLLDAINRAGS
jgi:hypothetical protein